MNTNEFQKLSDIVNTIKTQDQIAAGKAQEYVDSLVKPPRSMGKLEDIAVKLSGITGSVKNTVASKSILVFCADNGVTDEGVASAPVSVTMMKMKWRLFLEVRLDGREKTCRLSQAEEL